MIRVLLVDDHTMVREALRNMLERDRDIQIVGEAGDGEAALRHAKEAAPDVVVMDISLSGQSGIETTRRLLAAMPGLKVLGLSTHLEQSVIRQMLDAGASGYVTKAAAGEELRRGIRNVVAGRSHFCPETAALLAETFRNRRAASDTAADAEMSPRELQVITLLAQGRSAPEIAEELHISPHTVNAHRRNIMRKLAAGSVVDVTRYAIRSGLIAP